MQITTMGVRATLWLTLCLLAVSACVYEIPIQQGNFVDATALVQVKKGMTRAQVRYLLGTPMVPGGFDNDRWDYDYYLKLTQFKHPRRARAAVYFHNDVVDHVESDVMPVATDVSASVSGDAAPSAAGSAPIIVPTKDQTATPDSSAPAAPASSAPSIPASSPPAAPASPPTVTPPDAAGTPPSG